MNVSSNKVSSTPERYDVNKLATWHPQLHTANKKPPDSVRQVLILAFNWKFSHKVTLIHPPLFSKWTCSVRVSRQNYLLKHRSFMRCQRETNTYKEFSSPISKNDINGWKYKPNVRYKKQQLFLKNVNNAKEYIRKAWKSKGDKNRRWGADWQLSATESRHTQSRKSHHNICKLNAINAL